MVTIKSKASVTVPGIQETIDIHGMNEVSCILCADTAFTDTMNAC